MKEKSRLGVLIASRCLKGGRAKRFGCLFLLIGITLSFGGCRGASGTPARTADVFCYQKSCFSAELTLQADGETAAQYRLVCSADGRIYDIMGQETLDGVGYVFPADGGAPYLRYDDISAAASFVPGGGLDAATVNAVLFDSDPDAFTQRTAKDTVRLTNADDTLTITYPATGTDRPGGQITPLSFCYQADDGREIVLTMTAYQPSA